MARNWQKPMAEKLKKYTVCQETGCWLWIGSKDKDGYGRIIGRINYKFTHISAHRASFMHHKGPLNGKQVLHRCDQPCCINPEHLFLGTQQDNILDMMKKGRHVSRPHHGKAWHEARNKE